jgi:transcriptional regulator with XRE-family HTH domain
MTSPPLQNYLRTHRRRAGLFQKEVAALLGAASGSKVSQYENFTRRPGITSVFAYEIIFNRPARELFAGDYEAVRVAVRSRAERLAEQLSQRTPESQSLRVARKLKHLHGIVEPKPTFSRPE